MKERRGEEQGEPLGRMVSLEPGSWSGASWFLVWSLLEQPGWPWQGLEPPGAARVALAGAGAELQAHRPGRGNGSSVCADGQRPETFVGNQRGGGG